MLLLLAEYLAEFNSGFNVFQYLTLRAILGVLTALVISFLVGPIMIRRLTFHQIGQTVRDDGPQTHLSKAGTPTMGGALLLVAVSISTLLWSDLASRYVWTVIIVTLIFGIIGFYDDYKKLVLNDPKGLAARYKYFWQSVAGLGAALHSLFHGSTSGRDTTDYPVYQECGDRHGPLVHCPDLFCHCRFQ